jgi:clathrin heavy chain
MAPLPIKFQELVQLANVGVDTQSIGFNSCVRSFTFSQLYC